MKTEQYPIVQTTTLVNGFSQVIVKAPEHAKLANPGHYAVLNGTTPCYLAGAHNDTLTFIITTVQNGNTLSISSLQGEALPAPSKERFHLVQANEQALSAAIFYITKYRKQFHGLILLGAKHFPFKPCPSRILIPGMPPEVIAALPLFEDWQIPHRLASLVLQPGCFCGTTEELAQQWLATQFHIANTINKLYIAPV